MRHSIRYTAMPLILAILLLSIFGGCITKRDLQGIEDRLATIETNQKVTTDKMSSVDSLISTSVESNNRLKTEVRTSVDDINRQMAQLLERYNELERLLQQMSRQPEVITLPPTDSPGAQRDQLSNTSGGSSPQEKPAFDCIAAYDDAFILVRKSEYQTAIDGFKDYISKCPTDDNVANANYWIGSCYYLMEDYNAAISQLDSMVAQYPNSSRVASALYKLGRSHQELGDNNKSKEIYGKIIEEHAGTLEATQSQERLKDLK